MLDLHKNHKNLVYTAMLVYVGLSLLIAVIPAYEMQDTQPLPGMKPLTPQQHDGLRTYVSEDCMACHTQQVRNIEMDKMWGDRPSMPSDYYYTKQRLDFWRQSPSVLGSERTGPDLTNVGKRQPSLDWNLLHLYNPRIVMKQSVMPGYPWLFVEKDSADLKKGDVVVPVPKQYLKHKNKKIVATQKVLNLVAYLQSLKQVDVTAGARIAFLPSTGENTPADTSHAASGPNGEQLYVSTCSACHQMDGKGLAGAFPPLAGSPIVNDANPGKHIRIILQGYDARAEYGVMPPFADQLTDEKITAIANYERSSWGNKGKPVTVELVKAIRDSVKNVNL